MADKPEKNELAWRLVGGVVAMGAGFAARKVIEFGWTKATGKRPPANVDDPELRLAEALGFAVVMGVGMEVARILAMRTAHRRLYHRVVRKVTA
ncbi:DUF4235 domain-containing protein [Bailinhaonella thermotolerans]|uniref:DUF4235 domain-containing protein n=1 Tax=Bailinhaonella thermotolerans TaxID=1070861 RepID=A0A3A4B7P6_9ACTN|nr:DUF4235 domain-containing protein [Bailinhaonella thermotolerans]RJL34251.1 DUF4235 domain-containing protein [Bailinhaonella thermotolerans]